MDGTRKTVTFRLIWLESTSPKAANPLLGARFGSALRAMRRRNGLPKFLGMAKSPNPKVKRPTRSLGVVGAVSIAGDNGGAGGPPMSATRQVSVKQTAAPAAPAAAAAPRGRRRLPAAVEAIAGDPVAPAPAAAGHRPPLKLLARLRHALRVRHYSIRTEQPTSIGCGASFSFTASVIRRTWGRSRCRPSSPTWRWTARWPRRRRTRPSRRCCSCTARCSVFSCRGSTTSSAPSHRAACRWC